MGRFEWMVVAECVLVMDIVCLASVAVEIRNTGHGESGRYDDGLGSLLRRRGKPRVGFGRVNTNPQSRGMISIYPFI